MRKLGCWSGDLVSRVFDHLMPENTIRDGPFLFFFFPFFCGGEEGVRSSIQVSQNITSKKILTDSMFRQTMEIKKKKKRLTGNNVAS